MEYCREVRDQVVLESIVEKDDLSMEENYYFFPALVSNERPNDKWDEECEQDVSVFEYKS